jgi:hypothetical protein
MSTRNLHFALRATDNNCSVLNAAKAFYIAVQNLISFCLLVEHVRITTFGAVTVPGSYECETWSVTFRAQHILRIFQNKVLRNLFRPKGKK